MSLSTIEIFH